MKKIDGYSVAQLEVMLRQQKQALVQEAVGLRRDINAKERRLAEVTDKLDELDRAEIILNHQ